MAFVVTTFSPSLPRFRRLDPRSFPPRLVSSLLPRQWIGRNSDLGFSEAYMYGDISLSPPTTGLLPIFKIFLLNSQSLSSLSSSPLAEYLISYPQAYLNNNRFVNSLANTRSNISAHYDISNEMFEAFLSRDMTYSCGIFEGVDEDLKVGVLSSRVDNQDIALGSVLGDPFGAGGETPSGVATPVSASSSPSSDDATKNGDTNPTPNPTEGLNDPLYDAQMRKLLHIIRKADIRPGHRVLEIGSGASFPFLPLRRSN